MTPCYTTSWDLTAENREARRLVSFDEAARYLAAGQSSPKSGPRGAAVPTLRIPAFILVTVLTIAACSSGASPAAPSGASGSNAVEIKGLAFNPASISVKVGAKVTWTNSDNTTHTVTLDDNSADSGNVTVGSTFDHSFATGGTFAYHCKIHSTMHGTVVVTP
jgi:plastocyanin